MKDVSKIALGIFLGVVAVAACAICVMIGLSVGAFAILAPFASILAPENPSASPTPSVFDQIVKGEDELSPTLPWGQPYKIDIFEVTPQEFELVDQYKIENDEVVSSPPGATFLWVHIFVENIGEKGGDPLFTFKVYYKGKTIDNRTNGYYEAKDHQSFRSEMIFPKQKQDGWVLFVVPQAIDLYQAYFLTKPFFGDYTSWNFSME